MNAPDNIKSAKKNAVAVELPLMAENNSADMTPEAARNLLINGTAEFDRIFPPESAAEAVAQAVTTPAQRADATIAQFKARGVKFPHDTAGAVLCGGQDESEAEVEPEAAEEVREREQYWNVPPQAEILISRTNEDEIEIEQKSPLGDSEDVRICIAVSNAVRLSRSILYAAGFKVVRISTADGGNGCLYGDIEDGAEAWQFEREREGEH